MVIYYPKVLFALCKQSDKMRILNVISLFFGSSPAFVQRVCFISFLQLTNRQIYVFFCYCCFDIPSRLFLLHYLKDRNTIRIIHLRSYTSSFVDYVFYNQKVIYRFIAIYAIILYSKLCFLAPQCDETLLASLAASFFFSGRL